MESYAGVSVATANPAYILPGATPEHCGKPPADLKVLSNDRVGYLKLRAKALKYPSCYPKALLGIFRTLGADLRTSY